MTPEQIETNKQTFIQLLSQVQRPGIDRLINWLCSNDFFTAPASTKYHLNEEGGLCLHSLNVYKLLSMKVQSGLVQLSPETVIITALCHDICKANFYVTEQRWRKDENNKWESYETWAVDEKMPIGHGEKSCYILQSFTWISPEEYAMIRFHMGKEADGYNDYFTKAASKYPGVAAIHAADMESAFIFEAPEVDDGHSL